MTKSSIKREVALAGQQVRRKVIFAFALCSVIPLLLLTYAFHAPVREFLGPIVGLKDSVSVPALLAFTALLMAGGAFIVWDIATALSRAAELSNEQSPELPAEPARQDEIGTLMSSFARMLATIKQQWMSEWTDILRSNDVPINTYRVIGELERILDKENSIVTHDAGAPRDSIMPFYTATIPHSYIGWGKTTHLGYGIPLMIGTKLAKPDKFCLNFMGDGAFGMSGLDIETSVRAGAPITTIVLNNGDMATYPGGYPTARELFNVTKMTGDYAKLAEGMGAVGITVTRPGDVAPALRKAQELNAEGKTVLIDIHSNMESRKSRGE